MTRLLENKMVIDEMARRSEAKPKGTYEEMVTFQLGAIATMLADISKSLAVIADNTKRSEELSKYAESQYNKAIDDVLKLPKYTHYDTSNEFMNIRIDSISIEDILKLKESEWYDDLWSDSIRKTSGRRTNC